MQSPAFAPIEGVRVIGITGRARHGKDSLAKALIIEFCRSGQLTERWAFSDAVAVAERALPLDDLGFDAMATRDPRRLQRRGEYERARDPLVWLRATYGAIEDRRPDVAIVTGLRTAVETDMIWAMGGFVVRIVRRCADGSLFVTSDRDPNHPIERAVDSLKADTIIEVPDGQVGDIPGWARVVAKQLEIHHSRFANHEQRAAAVH